MKIISRIKQKWLSKSGSNQNQATGSQAIVRIMDEGWGHAASVQKQRSIDAEGNPLPWFTYPAIEYLRQLNFLDLKILEWGVGNSTRFFSSRCKEIMSIEHNKEWYDLIKNDLPPSATVLLAAEEEYEILPQRMHRKFNVIIVDGIRRQQCIAAAVNLIEPGGMIIFDNADRNPELCALLRQADFIQVDFHGFGPINPYTWTTSLFFSRTADFKPATFQPLISIGGGF